MQGFVEQGRIRAGRQLGHVMWKWILTPMQGETWRHTHHSQRLMQRKKLL